MTDNPQTVVTDSSQCGKHVNSPSRLKLFLPLMDTVLSQRNVFFKRKLYEDVGTERLLLEITVIPDKMCDLQI